MIPKSKLERFSAGERFAVDPEAIERELAALWRTAGESTGSHAPVTRACLWNVVIHVESRPEHEGVHEARALKTLVGELPRYLASRALVLNTEVGDAPELESWISANCILGSGGRKLVCSEEISFAARGRGLRHLPSLVRALSVPEVPSALVFGGAPLEAGPLAELAKNTDRLVTDVDRSRATNPLLRLTRAPGRGIDLGWLRLAPYRALIAQLFDPPTPREAPSTLERFRIEAPAGLRWSAFLLLAWIAEALGLRIERREDQHFFLVHGSGRRAEAELVVKPVSSGVSIVFAGGGAEWSVRALDERLAELRTPGQSARLRPVAAPEGAALLARALTSHAEDRAYGAALNWILG